MCISLQEGYVRATSIIFERFQQSYYETFQFFNFSYQLESFSRKTLQLPLRKGVLHSLVIRLERSNLRKLGNCTQIVFNYKKGTFWNF